MTRDMPPRVCVAACCSSPPRAPARAANKEHQQLMADIRMLQEQSQQLQNLIGQVDAKRSRRSTRGSTSRPNATRKAFADQKLVDRHPVERPARRPREAGRQQRADRLADAGARFAATGRCSQMSRASATDDAASPTPATAGGAARAGRRPVRTSAMSPHELLRRGVWPTTPRASDDLAIQGFDSLHQELPEVRHGGRRAGEHRRRVRASDGKYDKAARSVRHGDPHVSRRRQRSTAQAYYKKGLALRHVGQSRSRARSVRSVHRGADPNGPQQGEFAILCKQASDGSNEN